MVLLSRLLAFVLVCHSVQAAHFTKLDLVLEGTRTPMGDLLLVEVQLTEQEKEALIEVRGFTLSGKNFEKRKPILAKRELKDKEGNYFLKQTVERFTEGLTPVATGFTLAYDDIELPVGEHKIGFEATLSVGGKVRDVQRTPITLVTITEEPRTYLDTPVYQLLGIDEPVIPTARIVEGVERFFPDEPHPEKKKIVDFGARIDLPNPIEGGFYRKRLEGWQETGLGRIRPVFITPYVDPASVPEKKTAPVPDAWEAVDRTSIYFATNRQAIKEFPSSVSDFSGEIGNLTAGRQEMRIPVKTHVMGNLEQPGIGEEADPEKHFLPGQGFSGNRQPSELLESTITKYPESVQQDVFVYVHGFNNSMDFVLRRFAQLMFDIRFTGVPIAYVWPSRVKTSGYDEDEEIAAKSSGPLGEFLVELVRRNQARQWPGKIHLMAHSMGNRILLNALHERRAEWKGDKPFANIILVAPDIDAQDFTPLAPSALSFAKRVTHYHCREDRALQASRVLHINKRLGEAPIFIEGIDNVNAVNANTSLIGHDYQFTRSPLIYDLDMLINQDMEPGKRVTLRKAEYKGYTHWFFP